MKALSSYQANDRFPVHVLQHSVATGVISKVLCSELGIQTQNNIYLALPIHDVGKIILDRLMHDVYKEIVKITYNENISVIEAEQRVIGESHAKVGGWLMEAWNSRQFLWILPATTITL